MSRSQCTAWSRGLFRAVFLFFIIFRLNPLTFASQPPLSDGPYVLWNGSRANIFYLKNNKWKMSTRVGTFQLDLQRITGNPYVACPREPLPGFTEIKEPARFIAISDIHGHFQAMRKLLEAHKVVNKKGEWIYGKGHLYVVGDVADRGNEVTECFWFLKTLEAPAEAAGGSVQVLLGNHEAMNFWGNYKYVDNKYKTVDGIVPTLEERLGPQDEISRWIMKRSLVLKAGRFLFVHAGLSEEFLESGLTLEECNSTIQNLAAWKEENAPLILGKKGPIFFEDFLSSTLRNTEEASAVINEIMRRFDVSFVVVGHQTLEKIQPFYNGRVIGIDVGMKDGSPGEVLIWENQKLYRGQADGKRELLNYPGGN